MFWVWVLWLCGVCVTSGEFHHGKRHGRGLQLSADGSRYEGHFCDDLMHGQGCYTHTAGSDRGSIDASDELHAQWYVYDGDFQAGVKHGRGSLHYDDGSVYEGEFVSGRRHGWGSHTFADGMVYVGEYEVTW